MPSIKLGQALSVVNQFLGGGKGVSQNPKAAAVDLLKKSPLEMKTGSPTAHLVKNPLEFKSDFCNKPGAIHIEKNDAVQTAIRIGKTLFNKTNKETSTIFHR